MPRTNLQYALLILLIAVAAVSLWGWAIVSRGFSNRDTPSSIEAFISGRVRRMGIPDTAREARNPLTETPEVLAGAMEHFADHCSICHGNDGAGNTMIGRGLYPKPPDMAQPETQNLSDGELYYIIQNGIRLTGMPAFGDESAGTEDRESWALVAFIRHLPQITSDEVAAMKKLNPKSPQELEKEERIRKYLAGEDEPASETGHEHHH